MNTKAMLGCYSIKRILVDIIGICCRNNNTWLIMKRFSKSMYIDKDGKKGYFDDKEMVKWRKKIKRP